MRLAALLLTAGALAAAGCGDDERRPAAAPGTAPDTQLPAPETTVAETETAEAPAADDQPRDLFASVKVVRDAPDNDVEGSTYAGATILFAEEPDGTPHRILVPGDLDLPDEAARALRDEACGGHVDGRFEVVDTPASEQQGDLLLTGAELSLVDC